MPGILDSTPPPGINPGLLSAGNLVNANAPAPMSSSAIQALSDSMRTGALTAQDVIDRVGELGQTRRKAEIEMHKREIEDLKNPDLVAAKHAITLAAGSQANLVGTQAQAAQTLVPAQTQLQAGALAQGLSELGSGIPSAAMRQLNLTYNLGAKFDPQTGVLQNPDEVMPNLTHVMGSLNQMQIGKELGDRVDTKPTTDAQGNTTQVPVWKGTGKPLSPAEKSFINRFNGVVPGLLPVSAGQAPPSMVQPIGQSGVPKPSVSAGLPMDANGNLVTAVRTDAEKVKQSTELRGEMLKDKRLEALTQADPQYQQLLVDEHELAGKTPEQWRSDPTAAKAFDLRLAFNYFKILHPETRVTEQNFKEIEHMSPNSLGTDGQPIGERVLNMMRDTRNKVLNETTLNPAGRQAVLNEGKNAFKGYIESAKPVLNGYGDQAQRQGFAKQDVILPHWQSVLDSNSPTIPVGTPPPASTTAPAQIKELNGRKMISADGGKTWNWVQ